VRGGEHWIQVGNGRVDVTPDDDGVIVKVSDPAIPGYSQTILVPNCDRSRVASALRAGQSFQTGRWATGVAPMHSFTLYQGASLWANLKQDSRTLLLSAATTASYSEMQYPSIELGQKAGEKLAEMIGGTGTIKKSVRQQTHDNLRKVFG